MPAEPDAAVRSVRPLPPQLLANRLGRFFFLFSPPPPSIFSLSPCRSDISQRLSPAAAAPPRDRAGGTLPGMLRAAPGGDVAAPGCGRGGGQRASHPHPIPSPSTSSSPSPSHRAAPEASPEATGAVRKGGEGPGCSGAVSVLLAGVPHLMLTPPWDVGTGAGPEGAPQGHTWARRGEEEAGSFCRDNRILDVLFPRLNGPKPPKPCRCHWAAATGRMEGFKTM